MGECAAPAARFVIRLVRDDASFDVGKTGSEDRDDASVGSIASAAIAKIGTSAVDLLLAQMNDSLAETRYSAILGLRHCADPRIVLPLIGMFNDCDPGVRFLAVNHFCDHRDPRVVCPLLRMLRDDVPSVRRDAIRAIGSQGDRRAVVDVLAVLQDTTHSDRDEAAYALARIGDPGGLEAVVAALNDRHETPRLRMAAAGALGNARNFGRAAVELLNRVLQDTSEIPALRGDAARVLAAVQGAKVVPLLSNIARRPRENDRVRFWAAMSLIRVVDGAINDPAILPPLRDSYRDTEVPENLSELAHRLRLRDDALAMVAQHGKTAAIRSEASRIREDTMDPGNQTRK